MENRSLKGTQTEKNLLKAFAGESQANRRYTFYAKVAAREGYEKVADYFTETARNEEEHGRIFFQFLQGGVVEITASYPAGVISNTGDNLIEGAEGEYEEWAILYPLYAKVAEEEGFHDIARKFRLIVEVEKHHEERFRALEKEWRNGSFFKKDEKVVWRCLQCGYEYEGTAAPPKCPVCDREQGYFEVKCEKF